MNLAFVDVFSGPSHLPLTAGSKQMPLTQGGMR